jgi:tetratricopeptide (TPR) repeat protein
MKLTSIKIKWSVIISLLIAIIGLFYTIFLQPSKKDYKKLQEILLDFRKAKVINGVELLPSGIPVDLKNKINEFEKLIESVESSPFIRLSGDACFQISNFYYDLGDYKKANIFITKALKQNQNKPEYLANRIKINIYRNYLVDLEKDFQKIRNSIKDDEKIEILSLIAGLKYITGNIEECIKYSKETLDLVEKATKTDNLEYYFYSSKYTLFYCNFLKGDFKLADNYFVDINDYTNKLKSSKDLGQILQQKIFMALYSLVFQEKEDFEKQINEWLALYKNSNQYNPLVEDYIKFLSLFFKPVNISELKEFNNLCDVLKKKENIFIQKQLTYLFLMRMLTKNSITKNSEIQNIIERAELRNMELIDIYTMAGEYFFKEKEFEMSIYFLNKVLANLKDTSFKFKYMQTLLRIGQVEFSINNFYNANKFLIKSKYLLQTIILNNIKDKLTNKDLIETLRILVLTNDELSEHLKYIERINLLFVE